ncbi:TetR family transcriptional regulator [Rhizobium sp. Root73]|uniref:TetR/AcrR family transcriptional regulator n=1 Tax=unclassified Rhizobium TaxID=2613769 RepID=UPI00072BFC39|nr:MULTISPECIES: TetR/AcrR family transcriptional regulator [unclassified Rhizobium]KQY08895.1 TetR family transcriptional regulator [Rhizobium sp. Root1334]KRC03234.1 TetR family transcriptional regulator [Rhizobium sp. Root73]
MKTIDKRKERGDRARANILHHAIQIASVEGLEGLTFGRVAADAGVAKGNIQVLFGDKEALQLATIENGVALYTETVVAPAMAKPTAVERLIALVEGWYTFVEHRTLPGGCLVHALSSEYRTRPGDIRDRVEHHRAEARQRIIDLSNEAMRVGELKAGTDIEQLAFELTSHQASANVAALMGEAAQFELARRASKQRLEAARRV